VTTLEDFTIKTAAALSLRCSHEVACEMKEHLQAKVERSVHHQGYLQGGREMRFIELR
jgi:hypothetical protein